MKLIALTAVSLAALTSAMSAEARPSTQAEIRGYDRCVTAADEQSNGLVTSRYYFVDRGPQVSKYYVNGTRWEQGDRNDVRIACETTSRSPGPVSTPSSTWHDRLRDAWAPG